MHILCYKDVDNIYNNSGVETYNIVNYSLTAVGGAGLKNDVYWSSGEISSDNAWYVSLYNGGVSSNAKTDNSYVRLAFAF